MKIYKDTLLKTTLCGFIAGSISTLVACPGEQIKCIIQNDPKFKTPFSAAKHIIKNNGIQGLYRGMIFTNMRDAPAYAVYFLTYSKVWKVYIYSKKWGQYYLTWIN